MKTTRYFDDQVRRKRPYLRVEWIEAAVRHPARRSVQPDGRVRLWAEIDDGDTPRMIRVVLLADGETVHNAFFDRGYREGRE